MSGITETQEIDKAPDELITKDMVAKRLKLCTRKIELMVNAGEIPAIKIGASVRFNWNRVLEALENNNQAA